MKRKIVNISLVILAVILIMSSVVYALTSIYNKSKQNALLEYTPTVQATNILPPGSTSTDLQNAINSATSGDIIVISSNMPFSGAVTIPTGKTITLESTSGNSWTLSQTNTTRHFTVDGTLVLQRVTLDGSGTGGGLTINSNATFNMNSGTTIQNCHNTNGGSVITYGTFNMYDGTITNNTALVRGGGVFIQTGTFNMSGGAISENQSQTGGGVSISEYSGTVGVFNMSGGEITKNTASGVGGVHAYQGNFNMSGGRISYNTASTSAGGIALTEGTTVNITGNSYITNNVAGSIAGGIWVQGTTTLNISGTNYITDNVADSDGGGIYVSGNGSLNISGTNYLTDNIAGGNGGGIYTLNTETYTDINTSNSTTFNGNTASVAYNPPEDAAILYPNLGFASTSIANHPLNNYDINYISTPLAFNVTYNANGGAGSYTGPDIQPGNTDTVLSLEATGISRPNYTFVGWNTASDGSGTSYNPGDSITLNNSVILYARWNAAEEYTVNFESNGGSPVDSQTVPSGETATRPTDPTRPGYIFEGWFTDDGTFENKWDFGTPITKDVTLYAKWTENPNCKPCNCVYIWMIAILIIVVIVFIKFKNCIKCIICKIKNFIKYLICRIKKFIKCIICKLKCKCKKCKK